MPKRMINGERLWNSSKLALLTDEFALAYAYMYAMALADGTFECEPEQVKALCFGRRKGWTIGKVTRLLDEFERVGVLQRRKDPDGKAWAYWTGCEAELPSRADRYRLKHGKAYLFTCEQPFSALTEQGGNNVPSSTEQGSVSCSPGVGLGLVRVGNGQGRPPKSETGGIMAELLPGSEVIVDTDLNALQPGTPGYFRRGQYLARKPKEIHKLIARVWGRVKGEAAFAVYPARYPEKWEQLCDLKSADLIVPAFELWCEAQGARLTTPCPAGEFVKEAEKWMSKVIPLNTAKSAVSAEDEAKITQAAIERHENDFKLLQTRAEATREEGDGSELFDEEK